MKRGKTVLSILFCLAAVVFLYVNGLSSAASAAVSPRSAEREGAHRSSPSEAAPPAEEDSVPMPGEGAVRDDRASASDARTMEGMVLGAAPAEAPEMKQGIYSLIQSIKATCKTADSVASASDAAHPTPSNQSDLFASASDAAHPIPFDPQKNNILLDIRLEYPQGNRTYQIKKGDRLSIQLVPEAHDKDFLTLDYTTSLKKTLEDKQDVVADLNMQGDLVTKERRGIIFNFRGLQNSFRADLQLPFGVEEDELWRYFDQHPNETAVSCTYRLQYDGKNTGKAFTLRLQKPKLKDPEKLFKKTNGAYERDGEKLGERRLRYNIKLGTKLGPYNEFLIYDTPDVNLGFEGDLRLYRPRNPGMFEGKLEIRNGHYLEPVTEPDDTKMEIWIYDIYYLTGEPSSPTEPRQAEYEDVEHFDLNRNGPDGNSVTSKEAVTKPKHILVRKPMGKALTEEEEALIRDKGGLYQTVGKGFEIRLKNFKGNGRASGGNLFLNYTMKIQKNSPKFEEGLPIYSNTASYYGQEIPTCTAGQQNCAEIQCERSTLEEIKKGNLTGKGKLDPGVFNVQIDRFHPVDFKKVEMDAEGKPDEGKPLSGAVFSIYKLSDNGTKKEIASNNEGVLLKDLVTNGEGRLCRKTPEGALIPLTLTLEGGVYAFEEQAAPEGFERNSGETNVSVGFLENKVRVGNSRKGNEKEHPGGGNPGGENPGGGNPGGGNPGSENPGGGSHAGGGRRSGGSGGHGGSGVIQKGTLPRGQQEAEKTPSREPSQEASQKFLQVSPAETASVSALPDRSGNGALPRTGESRPQLLWKHILPLMLLSLMLRLLWRLRAKDRRTGR